MVGIFFSLSVTHDYNGKIIPQTKIGYRIQPNQTLLNNCFKINSDQRSRTIQYESGKAIVFICDGTKKSFRTKDSQVMEVLNTEQVKLGEEDSINHPLNYHLKEKDIIQIKRVFYKTYNLDEPISYQTVSGTNPLVAAGIKVVWQPGELGNIKYKIRERFEDGVLKEKKILSKIRDKEPITEIIAYGTGSFNGKYRKKFRMCASSYNPTVEQNGPNPFGTATGVRVRFGIAAVDPRVIKLGSRLWVSGYGYAIAADTGGLIKQLKIDLFFWRRLPNENWKGGYIDVYLLD